MNDSFYIKHEQLFKDGILKLLYDGPGYCVCNISNYFYALFITIHKPGEPDEPVGFLLGAKNVRRIKRNFRYFFRLKEKTERKGLNGFFTMDDKRRKIFYELKAKTDKDGPSRFIDLKMEEKFI